MNIINVNDSEDPKLYVGSLIFFLKKKTKKHRRKARGKVNFYAFRQVVKVTTGFFQSPVITNHI